jgi:hypothetical protein
LATKTQKTTIGYTQLLALPQDEEYVCKTAKTVEGAAALIEVGFQYVTGVGDV